MPGDELARFRASPYAADACRVRRWGDAAKDLAAPVPALEHFQPVLRKLARGQGTAGSRFAARLCSPTAVLL
jgi:predicted HD phosphohydrolase